MKESMLLLEVRCYDNHSLFKRRISSSYCGVEDWLNNNAYKWSDGEVMIDCDEYCRGTIYFNNKPMYTFKTTSIAVV